MSGWQALHEELENWQRTGRIATFWWRDDDAADCSPALDRLLGLAQAYGVPLSLAVIPALATAALARQLAGPAAHVSVLQHGFDHANHAPPGEKSMELGLHQPSRFWFHPGTGLRGSLFPSWPDLGFAGSRLTRPAPP
jgi:hypothetical protein